MIKSLKDQFQKGLHHQLVPGSFISPSHRELGNKVAVCIADVTEELFLSKSELITHAQERLREQHREREQGIRALTSLSNSSVSFSFSVRCPN